ncbi:MAG: MFS transporter [Actinomycetota bacterium]
MLVLLGTATFFEGYDSGINAVVLRDLAEAFNVSLAETGRLTGPIFIIGLGSFGAMAVTSLGDRIGRRPLLIGTTLMYALFTGLTAAAPTLGWFVLAQFLARTFLIAEYATAITMVAEEFPAARRGRAMGTLAALGAFGLPVAAVLHLVLRNTALGWRALYLVGLAPLLIVAVLRLKLRETERWQHSKANRTGSGRQTMRQAIALADRRILMRVSAVYFLSHFALLGAATWWPYYAQVQRNFSDGTVTLILAAAYPLGVVGAVAAGRLQDRFGRRHTGAAFLIGALVFTIAVFRIDRPGIMFPFLAIAVFFGIGSSPVLNALASELFPTEIRATAVAFARSIFGTLGAITGPFVIGQVADRSFALRFPGFPAAGNLGNAVTLAALLYIPAAILLLKLPETAGMELESISGVPSAK